MKIYAASSWRNGQHPFTVQALREAGHEVYDFRNPPDPGAVFRGEDADPEWFTNRDPSRIKEMLESPQALRGFASDMAALEWADVCVLTLPCGRSAHLELGWAVGAGKPTAVLLDGESEPELMYRMVGMLCSDLDELVAWADAVPRSHAVSLKIGDQQKMVATLQRIELSTLPANHAYVPPDSIDELCRRASEALNTAFNTFRAGAVPSDQDCGAAITDPGDDEGREF